MKTFVSNQSAYLIKQLPSLIAFINLKHEITMASDQWCSFFGHNPSEVIGKQIDNFLHEEKSLLRKYVTKCIKSPGKYSFKSKQNSLVSGIVEFSFSPWYDDDENLIGIIVETNDVTKNHEQSEKLEKLDALLSGISTISKVGLWEYNLTTQKLSWSAMTKKIHEVNQDYVPEVNTAIDFYKQGYSQNAISMHIHNAIEKKVSFKERLQIITKSGEERWVVSAGQPVFKNGKAVRLVGTIQDITEEVKTELKIKDSKQLLYTLINNLPLNVYIKDKDSRKILVNKSECDYLGVSDPKELLGKSDFDLYDKNIAQISRDEDVRVMKTLTPMLGRETVNVKKDGTTTTFLTSKIPLLDAGGEANGIIGLSMDITEIKNKENELHDLINVTAVQNKKLINFAHIVSHNLRSHTANFSMLLKFLVEEQDEAEKNKIIKMLTNASDNLMVTLDDLNQVVEISTNVNLEKKQLNVKQQIERVKENLSAFFQENHVTLMFDSLDKAFVHAVPAYLDSILMNLLTNAVKYRHPERKPVIKIGHTTKNNETILTISDNGLGIDLKKNGEKLFGMYKTFHSHKDSRGIGLYITKNQIEAMGGKITVDSKIDYGTTFKIYFYNNA